MSDNAFSEEMLPGGAPGRGAPGRPRKFSSRDILLCNFPVASNKPKLDDQTAAELEVKCARRKEHLDAWSDYFSESSGSKESFVGFEQVRHAGIGPLR